ncbi:unnamed protein product [Scytosiphon promiscuus]
MPVASVAAPVGDTLNQAWKNDKSKFGLKMLQKMGWTEGKGLGKHEDGVSEHVKVAKKSNNLGLGATHDASGAAGWASAAVSFNGVLEALGKAYGGSAAAAAGAGDKKKADKRMKKKARKAEKKRKAKGGEDAADGSSSGEGGGSSGGGGSGGAAKAASSCPSRARRVRSKDVKGFSQADLRAILGQAATTANPSLPSYPVVRSGYGAAAAAAPVAEPETSTKKNKKKRKMDKEQSARPPMDTPHRPRTRSMDETAVEPAPVAAKRPRSGSLDGPDGGGKGAAGGIEEAAGAGGASSSSGVASRKSKNKKRAAVDGAEEGAREVEGAEGSAVASSKEKKRQKKSKKEKVR